MSERQTTPPLENYIFLREKYGGARLLMTLKLSKYSISKFKKSLDTETTYTLDELIVIFKQSIKILQQANISRQIVSSPNDDMPMAPISSQIYEDAFYNCGEIISVFPEFKPILEEALRIS